MKQDSTPYNIGSIRSCEQAKPPTRMIYEFANNAWKRIVNGFDTFEDDSQFVGHPRMDAWMCFNNHPLFVGPYADYT